jgi:hypothetical protein
MDISKKLYANQMGPVRAFVLIMFSPDHGGRVGLHAHALDAASAGQMCADASKAFLRNVNQVREITPSGIIIP